MSYSELALLMGGAAMTQPPAAAEEKPIGKVTHYFGHLGVMALDLTDTLSVGDRLHIKGHTTDLVLTVESMQIEHGNVSHAKAGDSIGIKVGDKVRVGDMVHRLK
jgi:translation elongation factor EF-1alpha